MLKPVGSILIIDDVHDSLISELEAKEYQVDYKPLITQSEVLNIIHQYSGLVLRSKMPVDQQLIDKAEHLKFIARAGSGMENIDVAYAEAKGITCINSPEANRGAVGEQAVGMLLALLHNIVKANKEVEQYQWKREENRGVELKNMTVGVIGFGNTGQAFSKRLSGFGVNVIAYDKYKSGFSDTYVQEASLEDILEFSDVLSLHVPLTSETQHIVDEDFLSRFKKPIYLLNLSRGGVVCMADVIDSLKSGKIKGCAIDVLENENLSILTDSQQREFEFLISDNRVIVTPHIGGWSKESYEKNSIFLARKISELEVFI